MWVYTAREEAETSALYSVRSRHSSLHVGTEPLFLAASRHEEGTDNAGTSEQNGE
jgi:hypothetical protein